MSRPWCGRCGSVSTKALRLSVQDARERGLQEELPKDESDEVRILRCRECGYERPAHLFESSPPEWARNGQEGSV